MGNLLVTSYVRLVDICVQIPKLSHLNNNERRRPATESFWLKLKQVLCIMGAWNSGTLHAASDLNKKKSNRIPGLIAQHLKIQHQVIRPIFIKIKLILVGVKI